MRKSIFVFLFGLLILFIALGLFLAEPIKVGNADINATGGVHIENENGHEFVFPEGGRLEIKKGQTTLYEGFESGARFVFDNEGNLIEADLESVSDKLFVFGEEQIKSYPGLKMIYKDGKLTLIGSEDEYLEVRSFSEDGSETFQKLKITGGEVVISSDQDGRREILGNFELGGNTFYLDLMLIG